MRGVCTKEQAEKASPGEEVFTDAERGQRVHRSGDGDGDGDVRNWLVGEGEPSLCAAAAGAGDKRQEQERRGTLGSDTEGVWVFL